MKHATTPLLQTVSVIALLTTAGFSTAQMDSMPTAMPEAVKSAIPKRPSLYQAMMANKTSAMMIAEEQLKMFPGFLASYEADLKHGRLVFEFDIIQFDQKRTVELEVEAATGKLVQQEFKMISEDYPQMQSEAKGLMSLLSIWKTADSQFGPYLVKLELDEKRGRYFYEGKVVEQYRSSCFRANAMSGQLLPTK